MTATPNKDIMRKEKYRPTLVINIDSKILSKTLAIEIQQYVKDYVPRPRGIYPSWSVHCCFSIQNSLNEIHHINQ